MSWIEKLYETYERCDGAPQFENESLLPLCHAYLKAHLEIVISGDSRYRSARILQRTEQRTSIACTEDSASRSSDDAPHALCDKIQYCASDYGERGGTKKRYWQSYSDQLKQWCSSPYAHPKAKAVLTYLQGGSLLEDLIREKIVVVDPRGQLLDTWTEDGPLPPLFRLLAAKQGRRDQGDALVRWRVEIPGDPVSAVWEDAALQSSWVKFCASRNTDLGLCFVSGNLNVPLASKHPRGIRWAGDGAKLISSNDTSGYTFRGRFKSGDEACGVSFEVTQKAHNALRWLIARQSDAGKTAEQVFVSWSTGGESIPDPLKNTAQLFVETPQGDAAEPQYQGDAGQIFARRLNKLIAGYAAKLGPTQGIIVMGLDSATPGRMAITFYRELTGSEFLARVMAWHMEHAWQQNYSNELHFVGAPAPKDIAEAAYGRRLDDKLRKSTVERLLPCIVDGERVPRDLVESAVRRVCNRVGLKSWEWEKCLGIACSLYRGWRKEENYQMSLEEDRTSRDYLFGRLLAIADHLEQRALYVAGENRDTNAARLMQRFADHPCSTWRSIELALPPYEARLRAKRPPLLVRLKGLLDEVMGKFQTSEFTNDGKLSGEFLLELLDRMNPTIAKLTQAIDLEVEKCPEARRLKTHPGVGPLTALAFVLIIGRADRFQCGKQVACYLGLVPLEKSSGNQRRLGHITKQGNSLLRFLLVEAAQVTTRSLPEWRSKYVHLTMRRGRKIAKVAMARKLAVRLYWMMRKEWDYERLRKFGSHAGKPGTGDGVK